MISLMHYYNRVVQRMVKFEVKTQINCQTNKNTENFIPVKRRKICLI